MEEVKMLFLQRTSMLILLEEENICIEFSK